MTESLRRWLKAPTPWLVQTIHDSVVLDSDTLIAQLVLYRSYKHKVPRVFLIYFSSGLLDFFGGTVAHEESSLNGPKALVLWFLHHCLHKVRTIDVEICVNSHVVESIKARIEHVAQT